MHCTSSDVSWTYGAVAMPSNILAVHVRDHCDCCWQESCAECGQSVALDMAGDVSNLSGDDYTANHGHEAALSDCHVFWSYRGTDRACAIELKSKRPDLSNVHKQLQNGARLVESLADGFGPVEFVAILASPSLDTMQQREFYRRSIRFRGDRGSPTWVQSGSRLGRSVWG